MVRRHSMALRGGVLLSVAGLAGLLQASCASHEPASAGKAGGGEEGEATARTKLALDVPTLAKSAAGCTDCDVLTSTTVDLPLTGQRLLEAKLRTPAGRHLSIAMDAAGKEVDAEQWRAAEARAVFARQGRLRDDLYALSVEGSSTAVPVWIWANVQDIFAPKEARIAAGDAAEKAFIAEREANTRAKTSRIVAWLEARGHRVIDRGETTPAVTAVVPASSLRELGHLVDDVAVVGYRPEGGPNSWTWMGATRLDAAQAVVPSTGWAFCNSQDAQPDFAAALTVLGSSKPSSTSTSPHIRWTTELIAANAVTRAAPGAPTYVANWDSSFSYLDAWSWCFQTIGARAMNFSYRPTTGKVEPLSAVDMTFDYLVKQSPYPLIVASAGNLAATPGYDAVQVRGYNILAVGASDDANTTTTSDDTIASFSSWRNPATAHSDYEVPHLVAPGVNVSSMTLTDSGTSASSAIVMGAAILAAQQDPQYVSWPEMLRASVLAASTKPVDGVRTTSLGTGLDMKKGAGLLNANALVRIANPSNYVAPGASPTLVGHYARSYNFTGDFDGNGVSYHSFAMRLPSGTYLLPRFRVVIAFDSSNEYCNPTTGGGCYGDALDGDLDLVVTDSNGNVVCYSASYDSSWEICDFPAVPAVTYTARFAKAATPQPGTYLGIAWQNYSTLAE